MKSLLKINDTEDRKGGKASWKGAWQCSRDVSYWHSGYISIASVYRKNKISWYVKMINLSFSNVNNKKQTLVTKLLARAWIP